VASPSSVLVKILLVMLLGGVGAAVWLLVEQRERQEQLQASVSALGPRLDALDRRLDSLGQRLDALAQAGPIKGDPRRVPREERPFYAFRRLAVLPMPPLEDATDSLKAALTQLEQSLPVLLRKHTELEVVPPEEVARVKVADPVQAGRQLKAEAVLVVRPGWNSFKGGDGTLEYRPELLIDIHETETGFRILRQPEWIGVWYKDRASAVEVWRGEMPGAAKKIVELTLRAAQGRKKD
jgi:hypothetical protein